jgi:hypothetical protein
VGAQYLSWSRCPRSFRPCSTLQTSSAYFSRSSRRSDGSRSRSSRILLPSVL